MDSDYDPEARRSRPWAWLLLVLLLAFAGGMVAAAYAVSRDARVAGWLGLEPIAQAQREATAAQALALRQRPAPAPTPAPAPSAAQADTTQRLGALEDKVDDIQAQATAATGDASRAEGLLVAFAARRALDRGVELGYIEGLLRQRFGGTQPQAVAMILSASHQPVTLADLQTGFDAIAPALAAGGAPQQGWWQSFRQALSGMVVVRRAGEPSTLPADRVARAQRMLESGQVDGALAEVVRLPDHAAAARWIPAARRYLAGRGALDQIETAALLDPATSAGAPTPEPSHPNPNPPGAVSPVHPATARATD